MITISLCMIVKNEEETLAQCLDSIKEIMDEIIIIDTGSTDKTKEIAYSFTDKVYDFEWINDFAAARNFAFSKATKEYQLWLDADDIIIEKDKIAFLELKKTLSPAIDMVLMKYNYVVDENNNPSYSFHRERLLKRANNYQWSDPVHEYIEYGGNYLVSEIAITHKKLVSFSDRNLKIYEEQQRKNLPFSPRSLYYYARELRDHDKYKEAIEYFNKFLDTKNGAVDDNINACNEIGKIYKKLGDTENALKYLFQSFIFDIPRAEACCEIASIYKANADYTKAIYWYEFILTLKISNTDTNMTSIDCWNFVPAIELAVCYSNIKNIERAIYFNELAGRYKVNHASVLHNREYFNTFKKNKDCLYKDYIH
ncbi:glycosyltransferase family 2 protein [Flavobacterium pectinovorum]|uniref:Glycosyltransferase family 2 protein n=2 Tax=Flavobacterium pectinovorum TaxID=29533 RepID=A0A502E8I7_9FLAO|nr:glycosyltransferase family 2 protein [Flavobacterium pectinovorum]